MTDGVARRALQRHAHRLRDLEERVSRLEDEIRALKALHSVALGI